MKAAGLFVVPGLVLLGVFACADAGRSPEAPATDKATSALTPSPGETEAWEERPQFDPQYEPSVAYDQARGELVVVGAESRGQTDTWLLKGSMRHVVSATGPGRRSGASIAYDSDRKRVILFGGGSTFGYVADTWAWDGQTWTKLLPAQSPPPRYSGAMTYDPVRKVVLLTGGISNAMYARDTWSFDGQTWHDETPPPASNVPPVVHLYNLIFDEKEKVPAVVMGESGGGGCTSIGIFRFRAGAWIRETAPGSGPVACFAGAMYDSAQKKILALGAPFVGGVLGPTKMWSYDGTWQDAAPTPPIAGQYYLAGSAYGAGNVFLVSGGNQFNGERIRAIQRWDGTSWQIEPTSLVPSRRAYPAAVTAHNGALFLFGGQGSGVLRDTWQFDGTVWKELYPSVSPPARTRALLAFDSVRSEVVLYGGLTNNGTPLTDTWIWNGTTWTAKAPTTNPGPTTTTGAMLYDPVRNRTWFLDAEAGNGPSAKLWSWDGSTGQWTFVAAPGGPPSCTSPSFAFDPVRKVSVMFGGTGRDDTWTWDGTSWLKLLPLTRPPGRQGAGLAWDSRRERLVLFGGQTLGVNRNDVWTWDGQDWTALVNPAAQVLPSARSFSTFTGLGSSGGMFLLGGEGSYGEPEQWVFRARGGACKSGSECGSGTCVDGVCCESPSCGTCQTCAGADPGVCSPIVNAEDPDSCSTKAGKRCNEKGSCVGDVSVGCTNNVDCASGFCVDGVCCSTSCDLPCESCAAAKKLSGADDGRCGAAKIGDNPGGRCSAGAVCNATGSCESRTQAVCKDERTLDQGLGQTQDCTPYRCSNGTCAKSCKTYVDCAAPATCNPAGRCEVASNPIDGGDGCALRPGANEDGAAPAGVFGAILTTGLLARRRRRSHAARAQAE